MEDYKEKYEMALEGIREILSSWEDSIKMSRLQLRLQGIFPELVEVESEDERIKKDVKRAISVALDYSYFDKETANDCLAWLEKQGDKFGDNIITRNDEILQAISRGLTDAEEDLGWSDFGGLPIEEIQNWLEKQGGKMKAKSEVIKDYTGEENVWNNARDFRPKHMQRCLCYDKYMGGVYCYVYDDIDKYWCTQTTEEHDPDGDNHICDYADYRVTVWMCLPKTTFYPKKQGEQKPAWSEAFEKLRHKWSLGDSAEAKYKVEAFDELLREMLKEESNE